MQHHHLQQGSAEWLAYRAQHFNASDAPAMMGVSPYQTRSQLLHQLSTGLTPEVDPAQQRRFNDGHRFEALARPLAEQIIGEDLYPVVGSEGRLSASFDGLTMMEDVAFEHKSLNDDLRACMLDGNDGDSLPMHYQIQMEQQCMVSGCERVLFMASKWADDDTLIEERHCWYYANPDLADKIRAGWEQFDQDLCAYVPVERAIVPVPQVVTALPAVSVQVSGSIAVRDNLAVFETALRDFIDHRLIRKPETDQEFSDLAEQIKSLEKAESALNAAEAQMLSQVSAVDQAKRTKDMLLKLARDNRLMAEKLLAARKEQIKVEQVQRGRDALADHVAALNARLGKPYMPPTTADFASAIKGRRTVESLRDAVDTLLAQAKIAASATADRIQINLNTLRELAVDHAFLFADAQQIVQKAPDDLTMLVKARIAEHKAKEDKRLADEREKIRNEEVAALHRARAAVAAIRFPEPVRAEPPAPAVEAIRVPQPAGEPPAPMPPAPTPAPRTAPANGTPGDLITTAVLGEHLGITVTADLIAGLGFTSVKQSRPGTYWRERDVEHIRAALVRHIQTHRRETATA